MAKLLMIFLKETNGKPIPEQIKEIEETKLNDLLNEEGISKIDLPIPSDKLCSFRYL